jgi:hypothetical protein
MATTKRDYHEILGVGAKIMFTVPRSDFRIQRGILFKAVPGLTRIKIYDRIIWRHPAWSCASRGFCLGAI